MPEDDHEEGLFVKKRRTENQEMSDLADSGSLGGETITPSMFAKFALTRNLSPEIRLLLAKKAGLISKDADPQSDRFPSIFNPQQ